MALCGFTYIEVTVWREKNSLFISSSEICRLLKAVGLLVFLFFLRSPNKGLNEDISVTLLLLYLKNKLSGLLAWHH